MVTRPAELLHLVGPKAVSLVSTSGLFLGNFVKEDAMGVGLCFQCLLRLLTHC